MWSNCLFVALGGGLGAVGRYLLSLIAAPWSFPVMTLLTNFLGAVVIGAVAQAAGQLPMSKSAVLFLKTEAVSVRSAGSAAYLYLPSALGMLLGRALVWKIL